MEGDRLGTGARSHGSDFSRIKDGPVPTPLAAISSSRGTNEENYLFGKFIRCVMGTNHIDNCARVCHSATVTGMMETFGASAATNSLEDLDRAKLIMVVGANPTESHPVIGAKMLQLARHGVPLIVIDPGAPRWPAPRRSICNCAPEPTWPS